MGAWFRETRQRDPGTGLARAIGGQNEVTMVNPLEILPVLLQVLAIALIPLLSAGPPG